MQLSDPCKIYLIREGGTVKIGISNDPQRRLEEVVQKVDAQAEISWSSPLMERSVALALERCLHKAFDRLRLSGEWFQLNEVCYYATIATILGFHGLARKLKSSAEYQIDTLKIFRGDEKRIFIYATNLIAGYEIFMKDKEQYGMGILPHNLLSLDEKACTDIMDIWYLIFNSRYNRPQFMRLPLDFAFILNAKGYFDGWDMSGMSDHYIVKHLTSMFIPDADTVPHSMMIDKDWSKRFNERWVSLGNGCYMNTAPEKEKDEDSTGETSDTESEDSQQAVVGTIEATA